MNKAILSKRYFILMYHIAENWWKSIHRLYELCHEKVESFKILFRSASLLAKRHFENIWEFLSSSTSFLIDMSLCLIWKYHIECWIFLIGSVLSLATLTSKVGKKGENSKLFKESKFEIWNIILAMKFRRLWEMWLSAISDILWNIGSEYCCVAHL